MNVYWAKPVIALGLIAALSGCKQLHGTEYTYMTVADPQNGSAIPLKLQVMKPAATVAPLENGMYPGIIFLHGGSWTTGDRFAWNDEIVNAANKGYVAISVDFRQINMLKQEGPDQNLNPWPVQIQDVKCAVRWVKANATALNLDATKIGVWGESSGGHLAMMTGETPNVQEFEAAECTHAPDSTVSAVVSLAGIADFKTSWNSLALRYALKDVVNAQDPDGSEYYAFDDLSAETRGIMNNASPNNWVGNSQAPTLLIHADNDNFVPKENAQLYYNSMKDAAQTAYLLKLDRGSHFYGDTDGIAARGYSYEQAYKWFDRHLKGATVTMPCSGTATECPIAITVP